MHKRKGIGIIVSFFITLTAFAQNDLKGWHLRDETNDSIKGVSIDRAYEFLKGRKATPVIVGVIDSGIDTAHEDLKPVLWHNPKEIPGNGKDDDGNGYVDDIYGWNFLGGKDGRDINKEASEAARVYHKYKTKFEGKQVEEDKLTADEKEQYRLWKEADKLLKSKPEDKVELMYLDMAYKAVKKNEKVLKEEMKKDTFTLADVEGFKTESSQGQRAKMGYINFMKLTEMDGDATNVSIFSKLQDYIDQKQKAIQARDVAPENIRAEIVKDDYNNINDRFYGNNDVMGPAPMHGTHVAGIIGAARHNGIGMDGVAENVKVMMVRAVPDGDEYDKDIALAIKYAVDNGAKVINMSFGKGISPQKKWVDDAVRYAELKDVLIVHAAGNDADNSDTIGNFPNPSYKDMNKTADNFITVGASSDPKISGSYVAPFSNYGKNTVDVFAPGMKIYSTLPGGSTYGFEQGTSMASPVVAGIAALIRSYFPGLSAKQVKYAIERSVVKDTTSVVKPSSTGAKELVKLADLCSTGGYVNAYNAVKLAATLQPEKKENKKVPLPKATLSNIPPKS